MAASKAAWATVDAPENMTPDALAGATATIEVLLANGADRALADGDGLTALGVMRRTVRATNDFRAAMLEQQRSWRRPPHPALEAALRPEGGPTAADRKVRKRFVFFRKCSGKGTFPYGY